MSALVDQGPLAETSTQSLDLSEETANQLTHGLGLLLSLVGAAVLVNSARVHSDSLQFVGCCVYAGSLVALYAASTLSHTFRTPPMRHFFRMLDQVCIFLLIAGTFTPFALSYFRHGWLWGLTLVMWGLTCVGIFFKVCFRRLRNVSVAAYVLLAWIPLVAIREIAHVMPAGAMANEPPPPPSHQMIFDKPFLLMLRQTGAPQPYLALWIGNMTLLQPKAASN